MQNVQNAQNARLLLVNGAKVDMNSYDVLPDIIPPKSALGLQSLLITLPISKILKALSPEFEANLQWYKWQVPGFIYLWPADSQPYRSTLEGECL